MSDRVFEYMLVKLGKAIINRSPNKDSVFTIESYFNGTYLNQKPDTSIKYYPEFRLPTVQEWKLAIKHMDSVDYTYYNQHKSKVRKNSKAGYAKYQCGIVPCRNGTMVFEPTRPVYSDSLAKRKKIIYNLRGNVSEWTSESLICVGGGWKDSKETILKQDTFYVKRPSEQTGFRNVCVWKKWKK